MNTSTDVCILMATFNGERYLEKQLESFLAQDFTNWRLIVSDDGSVDETMNILHRFRMVAGPDRVQILDGPRTGFAQNFLSLLRRAPAASYYAFSDQDDIWLSHHLTESVACHLAKKTDAAMISSSRTVLVDEDEKFLGESPNFGREPSFKNALLQNIGGGNTMLLNCAARDLIAKVSLEDPIVSHDWLAYLLVTAVGGTVVHLEKPALLYRQHRANLVGMNISLSARISRCVGLFRGRLQGWIDNNLLVLDQFESNFTPENQKIYRTFKDVRTQCSILQRLCLLRSSGVYRQTKIEDIAIFLATAVGRI